MTMMIYFVLHVLLWIGRVLAAILVCACGALFLGTVFDGRTWRC